MHKTLDNTQNPMYNNCAIKYCAAMAQSVERILGKDEVTGSIPVSSSKNSVHSSVRNFYLFTTHSKTIFYLLSIICYLLSKQKRTLSPECPFFILHIHHSSTIVLSVAD